MTLYCMVEISKPVGKLFWCI